MKKTKWKRQAMETGANRILGTCGGWVSAGVLVIVVVCGVGATRPAIRSATTQADSELPRCWEAMRVHIIAERGAAPRTVSVLEFVKEGGRHAEAVKEAILSAIRRTPQQMRKEFADRIAHISSVPKGNVPVLRSAQFVFDLWNAELLDAEVARCRASLSVNAEGFALFPPVSEEDRQKAEGQIRGFLADMREQWEEAQLDTEVMKNVLRDCQASFERRTTRGFGPKYVPISGASMQELTATMRAAIAAKAGAVRGQEDWLQQDLAITQIQLLNRALLAGPDMRGDRYEKHVEELDAARARVLAILGRMSPPERDSITKLPPPAPATYPADMPPELRQFLKEAHRKTSENLEKAMIPSTVPAPSAPQ